ncbi:Imm32 family immunity protein [Amycolatopsis sp.]|jgi:hypothetical protein|uniref:Imm32 family immunity protein n=1 Tax=Amycolatopsis sp. TaxID=37632 RepID=UPI002E0B77CB|nr:hypothetical protein [Amycolatopsis sp.]
MIVHLSALARESVLSGDAAEYAELVIVLERGHGSIALDRIADPKPYDTALSAIEVRESDDEAVLISVDRERETLVARGPKPLLSVLAELVRDAAASGDPEGHVHVEYFPGHFYLGEGSESLTIRDAR